MGVLYHMQVLKARDGQITRLSVTPRGPSKLGSMPQEFHRSSMSSCFVAVGQSLRYILLYTVQDYSTAHHYGAP